LAKELGFKVLVVVGEDPGLAAGAGKIAEPVATPAEAKDAIEGVVRDGDVVLVKASRAVGLEGLAQELAQ
jgi:UDP-N-acetylmuramyl pentapeptide synthase